MTARLAHPSFQSQKTGVSLVPHASTTVRRPPRKPSGPDHGPGGGVRHRPLPDRMAPIPPNSVDGRVDQRRGKEASGIRHPAVRAEAAVTGLGRALMRIWRARRC